jgi:hypothetical protein
MTMQAPRRPTALENAEGTDPDREMWVGIYRGLKAIVNGLNIVLSAICKRWLIGKNNDK